MMETFLKFIEQYYLIFTIITIILILALIGYVAVNKSSKDIKFKKNNKLENEPEELF